MLERLLRGSGAAKAVFGQRIVGMGARNLRRGQVHQRHRLPALAEPSRHSFGPLVR
jgi:hypothetical protein